MAHRLRGGAVFVTNDHSEVDPRFLNRLREGSIAFNGIYLGRVTVVQAPYEYESRLSEMFPGVFWHLRLMALDPYDLALTKLERNIERDRRDVRHLARTVRFDLALLRERYLTEHRPYFGNPKRGDLNLELWIEAIEEERRT